MDGVTGITLSLCCGSVCNQSCDCRLCVCVRVCLSVCVLAHWVFVLQKDLRTRIGIYYYCSGPVLDIITSFLFSSFSFFFFLVGEPLFVNRSEFVLIRG